VRRVAVIGCIGAGKSTLARRLGARLGLPVIHLDRLWWDDSDYRITGADTVAAHTMPADEFRKLQRDLAGGDAWVIDGGFIPDLDTRLPRADTVVFLDLPRPVCLWRLVRRHNHRRSDYPDEVREGMAWLFLLARWIWRYPRHKRPLIEQAINEHCPPGAAVIRLRHRHEVEALLETIEPDR
jgi:adenylate kinase family enzyme